MKTKGGIIVSNPKGRTVPEVMNTYFLMLLIYCLDLFLLQSDRSVLGDNFYSRFVCLVVLFIILWVKKLSVSTLGITKDKRKILTGTLHGVIFSAVPLAVVTAIECIYYSATRSGTIDLKFSPPSMKFIYSYENLTPFVAVLIYILAALFGSVFKEFFFRGYVLKKLKSVMDFNSANLIQAALYMFMTVPYLLRNFLFHYYDSATTELVVFIVIFYVIHETVGGIKWGMLTRLTGNTVAATVDHFFYVFLANSIYITDRYENWAFMVHMLATQLISLAMVYFLYRKGMKAAELKKAEEEKIKADSEEKRTKEKAAKERHHEEKVPEIGDVEAISPGQFKQISRSSNRRRGEHSHSRSHSHYHRPSPDSIAAAEETVRNFSEDDVDSFLQNFSHPNRANVSSAAPGKITEDFDPDTFLASYGKAHSQRGERKPAESRAKKSQKAPEKTEEKITEKIEENTQKSDSAQQTNQEKKSFRLKDIFEVDTSDKNELL